MKRPFIATLLLALSVLSLLQCSSAPDPTPRAAPGASAALVPVTAITGAVAYLPGGGDPVYIPDFTVTVRGTRWSATTDLLGRFSFVDIPPGTYTLCWEQLGWRAGCTQEIRVVPEQSTHPDLLEVTPRTAGSMAWGSVRLADGTPAVQIDRGFGDRVVPVVEVLDESGRVLGRARTNADGSYAVPGVAGAVVVRASGEEARFDRDRPTAANAPMNLILRNHRPRLASIDVREDGVPAVNVQPGETITLRPAVSDPDGDRVQLRWVAFGGTITVAGDGTATWQLPNFPGRHRAYVLATDERGGSERRVVSLRVGAPGAAVAVTATGDAEKCEPLSLASVPPPNGGTAAPKFLTFMGVTDNSAEYYQNVDPQQRRKTLGEWWSLAGFNPADGSGGVAKAAYLNWNDLGFGRDMHFNQVGDNVYAWVTNYGCPDNDLANADLAAKPNPADAVATVVMEYAPIDGQSRPIVKFFVYVGGVARSERIGAADLDEWGEKPVPNLCQMCHGSDPGYEGGTDVNLGSSFLPFDLALLRYPGGSTTPPAKDLQAYYEMNQIIARSTNPATPIVNLINGWYRPLRNPPAQNNSYLPADWSGGAIPANAGTLYQTVIAPGCRTCHYSLSDDISWDSYQTVVKKRSLIQSYVCRKGPRMPQAAVTYINFWTNAYGFSTSPTAFLGQYSDPASTPAWTAYGSCTGT